MHTGKCPITRQDMIISEILLIPAESLPPKAAHSHLNAVTELRTLREELIRVRQAA